MTPRSKRARRPHPDPIGLALAKLPEHDQLIIVAAGVVGYTDRAVVRLVMGQRFEFSAHWLHPNGNRYFNPRRRIAGTFRRFGYARTKVELDVEADRQRIVISRRAYDVSRRVRDICEEYGVQPDRVIECAAPDCDDTWEEWQSRRGGRPREYCSNACRQRAWRHGRRASQAGTIR